MKLLISHNATPTTISARTMLINGMFVVLLKCQVATHFLVAAVSDSASRESCGPEPGGLPLLPRQRPKGCESARRRCRRLPFPTPTKPAELRKLSKASLCSFAIDGCKRKSKAANCFSEGAGQSLHCRTVESGWRKVQNVHLNRHLLQAQLPGTRDLSPGSSTVECVL